MMNKFVEENIEHIWITSDQHFFHKRIQEYTGRPDDWQNLIIDNWNNNVKDTDFILTLGDFALGNVAQIQSLIKILKGHIILLPGNHDRGRQLKLYKKEFFMVLEKEGFIYKNYIFTHRPLEKVKEGYINIHGHIHEKTINDGKHINVCVEQIGITLLKEIIK